MEKISFDLSWETVFRVGVLVFLLYAVYRAKEVLLLIVFALIISLLFEPLINFLQKRRFSRAIAAASVYFLSFGLLAGLIYFLTPLPILEINHFSQNFSQYFEKISPLLRGLGFESFQNLENFIDLLEKSLAQVAQSIFSALFALFGGILTTAFVIFLAFFFSLEGNIGENMILTVFPSETEVMASSLWKRCQKKVSGWFLSRILSCLFVGLMTYLILLSLGADYSFSLGVMAAISNFIPFVGPMVVGLLIFFLVFLASPVKAVLAIILFMLVHQIEGNIITPILSKRFISLPASLVLISLALGGVLAGFWGAILSIPLTAIIFEFLKEFLKKRKEVSELRIEN